MIAFEPIPNKIKAFFDNLKDYGVYLITKGVGDQRAVVQMRGSQGKSAIERGTNETFDVSATIELGGCKSAKCVATNQVTTLDVELPTSQAST